MRNKRLDIIVPCYNEQECISVFYQTVASVLMNVPMLSFRVIFVDDGSTDGTAGQIENLMQAEKEKVGSISLARNFGKEAAVYAGLKASCGDFAVVMDCDLQHPPELLPAMLEALETGYDCCAASRCSRKGEGALRNMLSEHFYHVANQLCPISIRQNATDYQMMNRMVVASVLSLPERERFSKGLFSWVGFRTKWLSYENTERAAGKTKWTMFRLLSYAAGGILSFSEAPLRAATAAGAIIVAGDVFYVLYLLISYAVWGSKVPGYASLMIMLLFQGGCVILLIGIISEYMAAIYREVKKRPLYLVKEKNLGGGRGIKKGQTSGSVRQSTSEDSSQEDTKRYERRDQTG